MFEEETLEIVFVLKVFKMAKKYIYIYTHTHTHTHTHSHTHTLTHTHIQPQNAVVGTMSM